MHRSIVILVAAIAGCAGPTPSAPDRTEPMATHTATRPLDGRYVVTQVDGAPPAINVAGHQPTVTFAGNRIHFQSQCIYADWTLRREGGQVRTKPYYEPGSAMCARALAPGETAIQDAFMRMESLQVLGNSRLLVAGSGHRLELRKLPGEATPGAAKPAVPVLAPVTTLNGEWRVAGIDGKPLAGPQGIALSGSDRELWWEPRCAGYERGYRIDGLRFTPGPRLDAPPPPRPGTPPAAVCAIGLPPGLQDVFRAVNGATTIGRDPSNGILLSGGGHSVLIYSQ